MCTIDVAFAVLCNNSNVIYHGDAAVVDKALGEISRILKPQGLYVAVSYEDPARRLPVPSSAIHLVPSSAI